MKLMREYGRVDCDVAREALSARIDGEREPVPSMRVDEHLRSCTACAAWYGRAREQAMELRRLSGVGLISSTRAVGTESSGVFSRLTRRARCSAMSCALVIVGLIQIAFAIVQAAGTSFGMVAAHHGSSSGAHLLNESTAWSAALGIGTVALALRRSIAIGLACVLVTYCGLLGYYVIADALAGQVTTARILSHLPVLVAAVLSVLVWRRDRPRDPSPVARRERDAAEPGAVDGRRLRPADDSAA